LQQSRINGFLGWVSAFLMVGIAALAFIVSFESIREFAARSGAVGEKWAWAIPLMVDGMMVMASIVFFRRSAAKERTHFPFAALGIGAATSFALNIAHAVVKEPDIEWAWVVSLIPPVTLLLTLELGMSEVRRRMAGATASETSQEARDGQVPEITPDSARELPHGLDPATLIEAIREASQDGPPSGSKLAAALERRGYNYSDRDGRRLLEVFRPPSGNGAKTEPDTGLVTDEEAIEAKPEPDEAAA